jgi:hypothetical protein
MTHEDIVNVRKAIDGAPCGGLADEINVASIAPNREKDYAPKMVLASGSCKKGDQSADAALIIDVFLDIWHTDPRGYAARGPCPIVWSDGGGGFLKGAHSKLEVHPLPTDHCLHDELNSMLLFNLDLKVYNKTASTKGSDAKHTGKRGKEAVKSLTREYRTHGDAGFTCTGAFLRTCIAGVQGADGSKLWTAEQVATMFKSGFADAQSVPAMTLLLRGIISLGDLQPHNVPCLSNATFKAAKTTLDVLARYAHLSSHFIISTNYRSERNIIIIL